MAVIKDIEQIKDLIPTFEDLTRCGNFASVKDDIYNKNPLYAFIVNDKVANSITTIKVKFLFLGLISTYALVLSNSDINLVNRYCEFVAIQRDVSKRMKITDWKWSYDEIGISLKSDNSSHSFIYFGTSKEDINYIKVGLSKGLRKETKYEKIEPELISLVIESLKKGKAVYVSEIPKRVDAKKDVVVKSPPPPLTDNTNHTLDVLSRYSKMIYGKEKEDKSNSSTITTDITYV